MFLHTLNVYLLPMPLPLLVHTCLPLNPTVYCTCLLCNHALPADLSTECNPQFYVNVADIDHLESLDSYVACTTEKIFQSKARLYDVFVDGCEFLSPSEAMSSLLKTTSWDQRRFEHLSNIRSVSEGAISCQ